MSRQISGRRVACPPRQISGRLVACFVGPGCLMHPWAAARPLTVRAASFARRVDSLSGLAPPPPTGAAAWPRHRPPAPRPGPAGQAAASHRAPHDVLVCCSSFRNFACNSPPVLCWFISVCGVTSLVFVNCMRLLLSAGPAAHRHRDQAPHPAITHTIPAPTPNFACNSPTTVSNLESTTLELQRFQTLLKLHPIELHATFA